MPVWLEAGGWGLLGGAALVLGAAVAWFVAVPARVVAAVMAFGAGVLISAVAFDLVEEAVDTTNHDWVPFVGIAVGCLVFAFGNWRVDQMGGGHRKDASHTHEDGDAF
ncbi:MAG TPA: hypothetical protein VNC22_03950, partial [Sporichthya sp.]|nr:hypothetical protein [Sporichthya sp.]